MSETRQRILNTARELFNTQGLARVGVRDIARAVGISAGNLAYHFPTKDDLVAALVKELSDQSAQDVFAAVPPGFSLVTLYGAAVLAMRRMLVYRFVLLSFVDAVSASPELRELGVGLWERRRARYDEMLKALAGNGYIDGRSVAPRAAYLHEQGEMISSGWLAADLLHHRERRSDEVVIRHYAKVGVALLEPHCTEKGRRQMRAILAGRHDSP